MMTAAGWTSLEIAKLAVWVAGPLLVALAVLLAARRLDRSHALVARRLRLYDEMAPLLNEVCCFFLCVGDFQNITPPDVLARKRALDTAFHVHEHLMSDTFRESYHAFIDACYATDRGARVAQLRTSVGRQRAIRHQWHPAWSAYVAPEGTRTTSQEEIDRAYQRLMAAFAADIGVPGSRRRLAELERDEPGVLARRPGSAL